MHKFPFIDQTQDPIKMLFVDNFSIIRVAERLFAVLFLNLFLYFFYQFIFNRTVAVDVIRCHAGLSAVQIFSEDNSFCRKPDICSLIHDTRTLSAQLKRNRRQVFCGISHYFFADSLAAGEKDIVKVFTQKTCILSPPAGHYSNILRFKAL